MRNQRPSRCFAGLWGGKTSVALGHSFVHVVVVASVQHRTRSDTAGHRTHLHLRGLQSKRPMRTLLVWNTGRILGQNGPKMLPVKDNHVVKALSAESPNDSLRDWRWPSAHGSDW
jgi:hypothetical protein